MKEYFVESKEDKMLLMRHKNEFDTPLNSFIRRNKEAWIKETGDDVVDMYGEIRFKIQEAKFREKKLEKFLLHILDSSVLESDCSSIREYTKSLMKKIGIKWKEKICRYFENTTPELYHSTVNDKDTFLEILLFEIVPYKIEAYWVYEKIKQKENKEKELFQIVNINFFSNLIDMIRQISRYCMDEYTKTLEKDIAILLVILYNKKLGIPADVFATPFFDFFQNKKYSCGKEIKNYVEKYGKCSMDEMDLLNELEDLPLECGSTFQKIQEIYDTRVLSQGESNRTVLFGDNILPRELLSPREFIRESTKLTKEVIQTYLENQNSEISFVLQESDLSFLAYEYGIQKCLVKNPEETKTFVQMKNQENNKIFLLFKLPEENNNIYGISLFPGKNHKTRELFSVGKPSYTEYKVQAGKGII